MSGTTRFLERRLAIIASITVFVAFSVAGTAIVAQVPKHHGDNCEWDLETFEVVCEDTPTPEPTETATPEPTETATPEPTKTPRPLPNRDGNARADQHRDPDTHDDGYASTAAARLGKGLGGHDIRGRVRADHGRLESSESGHQVRDQQHAGAMAQRPVFRHGYPGRARKRRGIAARLRLRRRVISGEDKDSRRRDPGKRHNHGKG